MYASFAGLFLIYNSRIKRTWCWKTTAFGSIDQWWLCPLMSQMKRILDYCNYVFQKGKKYSIVIHHIMGSDLSYFQFEFKRRNSTIYRIFFFFCVWVSVSENKCQKIAVVREKTLKSDKELRKKIAWNKIYCWAKILKPESFYEGNCIQ